MEIASSSLSGALKPRTPQSTLNRVRDRVHFVPGRLGRSAIEELVVEDFARLGSGMMPDAKTMGRWGLAVAPEATKQIHERIVMIMQDQGVVEGRRMRVDTTVVETNVH